MKGYVRQRAKPEGSMARGYTIEEALGFCIEYMQDCEPVLSSSRELSSNEVQLALQMEDIEADYNDESP